MTARMTPEEVRDFWTKQALEHGVCRPSKGSWPAASPSTLATR